MKIIGLFAIMAFLGSACNKSSFSDTGKGKATPSQPNEQKFDDAQKQDPDNEFVSEGPCQGKKLKKVDAQAAKSIFFYAPADANGGSKYYNDVRKELETNGFKVNLASTIKEAVKEFDGCSLWASYKQIWMWLPCKDHNITKSMDPQSLAALKAFYEGGGGLLVLPDNHFNNDGSQHCGATDYAQSIDLQETQKMLGISFSYNSGANNNNPAQVNHALALARAQITNSWQVKVSLTANSGWQMTDQGQKSALKETTLKNGEKSIAFVIASAFNYHGIPGGAMPNSPQTKAYLDIANYFENNLRTGTPHKQQSGFGLIADNMPENLDFEIAKIQDEIYNPDRLLAGLQTTDAQEHGIALVESARRGMIGFDDIYPNFLHERYRVRVQAAEALSLLPNKEEIIAKVVEKLDSKEELSKQEYLGLARTLQAIYAPEQVGVLDQLAAKPQSESFRDELSAIIASLSVN